MGVFGAPWGPFEGLLGGLLGRLGDLWGLFESFFGRLRAFLAHLTPSGAVDEASRSRLRALMG
eukprot:3590608-Pyramimonas_sp.AAC.1